MFGLMVNTLTARHKFCLLNREKITQAIQMQLSKKQKPFSQFFRHIWNAANIWNTLKKRGLSQLMYFRNSRSLSPFKKLHGKRAQTLFKSEPKHIYQIHSSMWRQLNWKNSLLVICKIFELFVNTWTAGHKFSLLNRDKSTQAIQMQLSKNKKLFLIFYFILKMCLKFWTLSRKDAPKSWCISEITDSEKRC